jgi:ribosomal protein S18 acetylase RimI-like enzyme
VTKVAERDFAAAWWIVAEAGGMELHDDPGLRWFSSGLDDAHLNAVVETKLDVADVEDRIDGLLGDLRDQAVPMTWWVTPSSLPRDLGRRLAVRGLVAEAPWPAMVVPINRFSEPPSVPGLDIRRVTDLASYTPYEDTFAPMLSSSPDFTRVFAQASERIGFAEDAPLVHYVGYLGGEAVATSSLITAGGAAGIYNVTTVEGARGRGIGSAMTATAVRAGFDRGMRFGALQASSIGRPVYERLGFAHVCDFVPYGLSSSASATMMPSGPRM